MLAVAKKEIKSYFFSPIAYIICGLFILITSIFFSPYLMYQYGEFTPMLETIAYVLIFLVPMLTMRLFSEDRKSGAEVFLMTSPTSLTSVVIGKYLAALSVFGVLTALSFVYPVIQVAYGGRVTAHLIGGYIGFFLLGAAFIAIGLFAAALTENQVIAAIVGFVSLLIMWLAEALSSMLGGFAGLILGWFSLITKYREYATGVFGLAPTVYFISFTAVFIFLTIRIIDRRRWGQG
ncbi:MAG: ABC-2 transporter permease [Oscillospiraceae bacterium]|nr:ABC-2 transporter permease [Oscillospiraceae bacterium]